jgi:hypothetical protein
MRRRSMNEIVRHERAKARAAQAWIDSLEAAAVRAARPEVARQVHAVVAALKEASDFHDAQRRLVDAYRQMGRPIELARIIGNTLTLACLAGRAAVREDAEAKGAQP